MTRNRASAKAAGSKFAKDVADYLAKWLDDDRIEKRKETGRFDRGDITAVRVHGKRVVVQCKNWARTDLAGWATDTEEQRINDGALVGVIAAKRHGNGKPGDQWIHMTVRDFCALITGSRPDDDQPRETTNDQ